MIECGVWFLAGLLSGIIVTLLWIMAIEWYLDWRCLRNAPPAEKPDGEGA